MPVALDWSAYPLTPEYFPPREDAIASKEAQARMFHPAQAKSMMELRARRLFITWPYTLMAQERDIPKAPGFLWYDNLTESAEWLTQVVHARKVVKVKAVPSRTGGYYGFIPLIDPGAPVFIKRGWQKFNRQFPQGAHVDLIAGMGMVCRLDITPA